MSALPIPGEDVSTRAPATMASPPAQAPETNDAAAGLPPAQAPGADERKQLNDRIEALSSDVARLEQKLLDQDQKKQDGGAKVVSPRRMAASAQRKPGSADKPVVATPPAPIVGLTLKAIVDESAWLQTESGETVMVQPGDVIHGVGTVKTVDPDAGAVRLTDGRVLR